jgi:predicted enzyme related to lactoylglutathione lyase
MPDRPTSSPKQFIQGAPTLHVPDVEATARFYRDVLGFTWDFGDANYAVVWRDNAAVHFAKGEPGPQGVHLFFWVRDVDACHREFVDRGAGMATPPVDRPYGLREMGLCDPNGVGLVFGQEIEPEG